MPYTLRWAEPRYKALGVNNAALGAGLFDVQGYNPLHLKRYDEFMAAVNGRGQDHHHADVLGTGVNSPLLDFLNVRYVVVPSVTASDEVPVNLERGHTLVYEDQDVQIFESPDALPHLRIVYEAQEVRPGDALALLTSGTIDSRQTTILEVPPPPLQQPAADAHERVELVAYEANRIQVLVTTTVPGMLVMSEVHYPAWRATVDGKPATVYVADHVFRAVPIAEGTHMVELRYASETLQVGLLVSVCAVGLLLGLIVGVVRRRYAFRTPSDAHASG
jgi:hypothetical protein